MEKEKKPLKARKGANFTKNWKFADFFLDKILHFTAIPLFLAYLGIFFAFLHSRKCIKKESVAPCPFYLIQPPTREELPKNVGVADGYYHFWKFPHGLGAMDGKRVRIKAAIYRGSIHYNHERYYSIRASYF